MRVLALFFVVYADECIGDKLDSVCDETACTCPTDACVAKTKFCLKGTTNVLTELTDDNILEKGAVAEASGKMFCVQGNFNGTQAKNEAGKKVAKCKKDSLCNPFGTKTDDAGETKDHLCLKANKVLKPGMKAEDGDKICIGMIAGKCAKDTFCNPRGNETNDDGDKITHLCLKADKVLGLGKSDNTTEKFCIGNTTAAECAAETRCNPRGNITAAEGDTADHLCVSAGKGRADLGDVCITQVITLKCSPDEFCNPHGTVEGDRTAITNVCIKDVNFLEDGKNVTDEKKICVGKTKAEKCETKKNWCDHEFASGCVKKNPKRCADLTTNITAAGSTEAEKKAHCSKAECIYKKGTTESCEKPTCKLSRKLLEDGVCNGTSHKFNAAKNAIMCDGNCTKELCCAAVSKDDTAKAAPAESAIWGTELEIYVIIGCFCALFLVAAILFLGSFLASSRDASGKIQYHTPTPAYLKQRTREAWSQVQTRFTSVKDFTTRKKDNGEKTPMLPKPLPQAQVKNPNESLGLAEFVQQSRKQMQKQNGKGQKNNTNQKGKGKGKGKGQQDRNVTWKRKVRLDSKGRNTKAEGSIRLRSDSQKSGRKSKNSAGKNSAITKGAKGSKHSAGSASTRKNAGVSKYSVGTAEWAVALSSAKKSGGMCPTLPPFPVGYIAIFVKESKNAAGKTNIDKKTSVRKNIKDASSSKESKHASNRKNVKGKSNRQTEKKNFNYKV